jgi:hypothetical protein
MAAYILTQHQSTKLSTVSVDSHEAYGVTPATLMFGFDAGKNRKGERV